MQLRLQTSYFRHLSRPSLVHHEMHTSFTEMHLLQQMTDDIFEIETTAVAHVACAPQESGNLLTDFAAAYPCVNHSWIFSVLENTELPGFICRFLRSIYSDSITHVDFCGSRPRTILHGQRCKTGLSSEWFLFCNGIRPYLQIAPRGCYSQES